MLPNIIKGNTTTTEKILTRNLRRGIYSFPEV
jgi:hypothetical protein